MEGNKVYLCKWTKVGKKFKLWLDKESEVSVESLDFGEGAEDLAEKVAAFYKDFEAILEFDPPTPAIDTSGKYPEVVVLGYNEFVDLVDIAPDLFVGGVCSNCRKPRGERTGKELIIKQLPKNDVAGTRNWAPSVFLFSELFVNLITPEEKANLKLKEVLSHAASRRKFFEVSGNPIAQFVGVKGATYSPLSCWKCPECNASRIYPRMPPGKMFGFSQFVCFDDLPKPIPTTFVISRHGMPLTPCMLKERWRQIVGKPGAKGLATHSIGIVSSDLADYDPPLPIYRKE